LYKEKGKFALRVFRRGNFRDFKEYTKTHYHSVTGNSAFESVDGFKNFIKTSKINIQVDTTSITHLTNYVARSFVESTEPILLLFWKSFQKSEDEYDDFVNNRLP